MVKILQGLWGPFQDSVPPRGGTHSVPSRALVKPALSCNHSGLLESVTYKNYSVSVIFAFILNPKLI